MFVFSVCTTYANYCSKTSSEGINKHFCPYIPFFLPLHFHISAQKLPPRVQASISAFIYPPSAASQLTFTTQRLPTRVQANISGFIYPSSSVSLLIFLLKSFSRGYSKHFRLHIPSFRHFTAHITRIISCTKELDQLGSVLSLNHIVHFL